MEVCISALASSRTAVAKSARDAEVRKLMTPLCHSLPFRVYLYSPPARGRNVAELRSDPPVPSEEEFFSANPRSPDFSLPSPPIS